ncbi:hypothetical protein PQX77_000821 [Marasmius sp. AFHP31]|nr:hypothetical protein PQX77_000821 [Marasmius sp. AFHP31]
MESICETCKFTPSVQYPPISRNQFRSELAIPNATLIQIASIIEEEERHIEHCSSEILRVQKILKNLQNDKRALGKQVAQHRSYISPIRRVPHELWMEIFSICISEQQLRAETESKKMKRGDATDGEWRTMFATPFRLTGVCLRWRTIVSSTPAFWSTIFYKPHWKGCDLVSSFIWSVRRGTTWTFPFVTFGAVRIERSGALAFRMLLDCMPRIRGLSAAASNVRLPFPDSQPPDCSFPRLRFLDVQEIYSQLPAWFVDAARQATDLERLVAHDMLEPANPLETLATRPSLKCLELDTVSTGDETFNTILNLPYLESLTIGGIYSPYTGQRRALAPHVMCSSLRYLTISHGSSSLELLQSLEMPNLQSLHLRELSRETSTLNDALLVLSKFAPKPQSFTLSDDYRILPGGKLMDLLQALPNVVTFEFGGGYDTDDPAATASASKSIRALFSESIIKRPRLEYLSLSLVNISVTEEVFAALIELLEVWAQRQNTASLKCIRFLAVDLPQEGKQRLISRLENWKDSGFKWALGKTLPSLSEEFVRKGNMKSLLYSRLKRGVSNNKVVRKLVAADGSDLTRHTSTHTNLIEPHSHLSSSMENICESCKFTPSVRHPPISRDQFRAEFAIPDATLIQITGIIEQVEKHLKHRSSEKLRTQEILTNIRNEDKALEEEVAQLRSYVSPIRRVPYELWVKIFSLCIAEQRLQADLGSKKIERTADDEEWRTMFATPLRLAGVCLRWRTVTASTPAFWSRIYYNLHWLGCSSALNLYLECSGGHDMDMILCDVQCSDRPGSRRSVQEWAERRSAFQMLLSCIPRIREFIVVPRDDYLPFPDTQPFDCSFGRLQSLEFQTRRSHPRWFLEAVSQAPVLEKLVVRNDDDSFYHESVAMMMNPMVKCLELSDAEGGCLDVILSLQHLESLTIGYLWSTPTETIRPRTCRLRQLTIGGNRCVLDFLRSVEMPHLQSLHVQWIAVYLYPGDTLQVLSRFSTSVQHLSLSEGSIYLQQSGTLVDFLHHFPNLITFRFRGGYEDADPAVTTASSASLCALLSYVATTPHRLESLSLSLVYVSPTEEVFAALIGLLEAWTPRQGIPSLKCISFLAPKFPQRGKEKLVSRLEVLESERFQWALGNELHYSEMLQEEREHESITMQTTR